MKRKFYIAEQYKNRINKVIMEKNVLIAFIDSYKSYSLPLIFIESKIYIPYKEKKENGILYALFRDTTGEKQIYFLIPQIGKDSYIRKKFRQSIIEFGFNNEKETMIKKLIVNKLLNNATICEIPSYPGWIEINGEFDFTFPEQLTWKEIKDYV